MKISLKWLSKFVELPVAEKFHNVVVGKVLSVENHPNAEKLHVAKIDVGSETLQIVCGGTNLQEGQLVPVALVGAKLPGNIEITEANLRGVESYGMICAKEELRLGEGKPKEIMILETTAAPGTPLNEALGLKGFSPSEIQNLFTIRTAEVEKLEYLGEKFKYVVTGKLLSFEKIPETDKLHKAVIDIGTEKIQLIFGMVHQVEIGWILPIALPGAIMANGKEITKTTMRGVETAGMIADDKELGIENTQEGLTIFPKKTPLGIPIADALGLRDIILEIDNKSLTHRPDLWGHYGIAREISAIFGTKLKPYEKAVKLAKDEDFTQDDSLKVTIQDPKTCMRFVACSVSNVKIEESPDWLKRDLIAVGIRPVNNVVDVTNHLMLGLGQPMHAFDRKDVQTDNLKIRFAKKGETFETLDHKTRELNEEDVIIENGREILSLAGIMGGKKSEVHDNTTDIIFEAATWNPSMIRKTSVRQNLRTEAVQRFEKSLDPEMTEVAVRRACALLQQICPSAKISSRLIDVRTIEPKQTTVIVPIEKIQKKIGVDIAPTEIIKILKKLRFGVTKKGKELSIEIPSFRATKDVSMADDITEEVARMYGYENLKPILPELPIRLPEENLERMYKQKAREILAYGLGFDEAYNYSFYSISDLQNSLLPEDTHLQLKNFLSTDQTHLRISLVPNILKNVAQNLKFFDTFEIFEIGHTYIDMGEYFPLEEKKICAMIVKKNHKGEIFYEAKGALEQFLKTFGANLVATKQKDCHVPYAHPNKYISYRDVDDLEIARAFELHPMVMKNNKLEKVSIGVCEINFTQLVKHISALEAKGTSPYKPLPKFPSNDIDVSVITERKITIGEIETLIRQCDPALIDDVELFDLYEGENIGQDKKSLAFRVKLQSPDRTLTDEEMTIVQKKIFQKLTEKGGQIRGI